ncbi:SDR family NAD(P)-dependent oxidoreductase [Natronosalvus vescus]|uniref:SDR family NAD(P)-dependent oxidoreductase n=1 Tax=Natronosalvus vescus TaxID=2953881 RepID=UPI0020917D44|nr:SDR family oxidoreductase [Natronosalvus vescus]
MTNTLWILGGSGDIGRAVARRFGDEGRSVWLSARTPARLQDAADELVADGIDARATRADAARRDDVTRAVPRLEELTDSVTVFVYNITPQHDPDERPLEGYLRHTVEGFATAVDALFDAGMGAEQVVVPTSSRARNPDRLSPASYAAKQALFGYLRGISSERETTGTVLWLGRRGTETDWRWLRPQEMAESAWESYEDRPDELLVGDLY